MGEIYQGKSFTEDLLVPVPVRQDIKESPSVEIGEPMGTHVANFYHTVFSDDLYHLYFMRHMGLTVSDSLDAEEEEEY